MLQSMPWCTTVWCCLPDDHPVQLSELRCRFSPTVCPGDAHTHSKQTPKARVKVFTTAPLSATPTLPVSVSLDTPESGLRDARLRQLQDMHAVVLLGGLGARQWTDAWMPLVATWLACGRQIAGCTRLLCLLLDASHASAVENLLLSLVRCARDRGWVVKPPCSSQSRASKSAITVPLVRDTADTSFVATSRRFLFRVLRFRKLIE